MGLVLILYRRASIGASKLGIVQESLAIYIFDFWYVLQFGHYLNLSKSNFWILLKYALTHFKRFFVRVYHIGLMQKYPPIFFLFYVSSFY